MGTHGTLAEKHEDCFKTTSDYPANMKCRQVTDPMVALAASCISHLTCNSGLSPMHSLHRFTLPLMTLQREHASRLSSMPTSMRMSTMVTSSSLLRSMRQTLRVIQSLWQIFIMLHGTSLKLILHHILILSLVSSAITCRTTAVANNAMALLDIANLDV